MIIDECPDCFAEWWNGEYDPECEECLEEFEGEVDI